MSKEIDVHTRGDHDGSTFALPEVRCAACGALNQKGVPSCFACGTPPSETIPAKKASAKKKTAKKKTAKR